MLHIARWKVLLVLFVCFMGFAYSAPNFLGENIRTTIQHNMPGWFPSKTINLGLDLQGGSHLLLEVDYHAVVRERIDGLEQATRSGLREEKILPRVSKLRDGLRLRLRSEEDAEKAEDVLREQGVALDIVTAEDGMTLEARFTDEELKNIQDQTIEQSIEIVRRRVDETGTREPAIQRQGEDRIIVQLPGLDDPQRIKELLGRTAQLSFHLVNDDLGSNLREGGGAKTLPMAEQPGQTMSIARRAILTGDMIKQAQPTFSQQSGQPVVSFALDSIGAKRFCNVTRENTGKPFAIVLKDGPRSEEIISAPRINEPICGGAAIISGAFSIQEVTDLALLIRAGALPAPLEVLEERTVGPSLGADSVEAGKMASIYGLVFILIFMGLIYGLFGMFANIALVVNMALIFAVLSGLQATLTLPGIAGIVLTIGMAVDANVLIFERIKEEMAQGRGALAAVDIGYSRAMSTIIDSNLTTLIAAIILFSFGTGPIKGFAVTLGVGIVTSFFSAIMVTRLMVAAWVLKHKPSVLPV